MSMVPEQQDPVTPAADPINFAEAVPRFLEYVGSYRSYSPRAVQKLI
jgi:hypothetical protein